jgi:hypothetical protein
MVVQLQLFINMLCNCLRIINSAVMYVISSLVYIVIGTFYAGVVYLQIFPECDAVYPAIFYSYSLLTSMYLPIPNRILTRETNFYPDGIILGSL